MLLSITEERRTCHVYTRRAYDILSLNLGSIFLIIANFVCTILFRSVQHQKLVHTAYSFIISQWRREVFWRSGHRSFWHLSSLLFPLLRSMTLGVTPLKLS